ncbi:MAG: hypothetical protein QY322_04525 [bacterium]|nr:MAG: hypothetical protein QY322_04525 [bacterium]
MTDILTFSPGPKELIEKASNRLTQENADKFAVDKPLNDDFLISFTARTLLEFDDGDLELRISLTQYKKTGELTQEILLQEPHGKKLYRLDISSSPKKDEEKSRMTSLANEMSDKKGTSALSKMLSDTFGTSGNTTVSRMDNWAETNITTDSARQLIEIGTPKLPEDARITLLEFRQKVGQSFPLLK